MKTIEVVAAIIKNENKILATQRGYGEFIGGWEFPGGKIEAGETQEKALKREIFEELKVVVEIERLAKTIEFDYPNFHLTMHCYWCKIIGGKIELTEHTSAKWLDKAELDSVNWLPADVEVIEFLKLAL